MHSGELIPRIWADKVLDVLQRYMLLGFEYDQQQKAAHEQRMRDDPAYAAWYEEYEAANETESYWTALYENAFPVEEEE